MAYESSPVGHERTVVFFGVHANILHDHTFLKSTVKEALLQDQFTILDLTEHEYSPQGYALVALLAESHAALHTYPEYNSLVFNIYSCRRKGDGDKVIKYLQNELNPTAVQEDDHAVIVKR